MQKNNPAFLITIDVEDWFQVENFKPYIPRDTWNSYDLRVERNTHRLLDLFDQASEDSGARRQKPVGCISRVSRFSRQSRGLIKPNETNVFNQFNQLNQSTNRTNKPNKFNSTNEPTPKVRGTFFILGWIAERLPNLIREIQRRGHEVASHGFGHQMCNRQSPSALKTDLVKSRKLLEDITGAAVRGYRAPSFSVDNDILKIIEEAGYGYDASYNSFDKHGRYGKLMTNGFKKAGIAYRISDRFYELPLSNLNIQNSKFKIQNFLFPLAGGGYFRLIPDMVFNRGAQAILDKDSAYHFYMHPWEIDPSQPRVDDASAFFKFRHYVNLRRTEKKLKNMIKRFRDCRFMSCGEYLAELEA